MNATDSMMNRTILGKSFTIAAVTVLALGLASAVKAESKGCSAATLKGTFSQKGTGVVISPPAFAGPVANVGTLTFDGNGGVAGYLVNSLSGYIVSVTESGTYKVNADCTGTYTVQISAPIGITATAYFVIDDGANGLQIITTDAGAVITCVARRQFPAGDWRQ